MVQSGKKIKERPLPGERRVHKSVTIKSQTPLAVMASGAYRHFFDDHGKRYSLIIGARPGL